MGCQSFARQHALAEASRLQSRQWVLRGSRPSAAKTDLGEHFATLAGWLNLLLGAKTLFLKVVEVSEK